jgi:YD repeat-containing protein
MENKKTIGQWLKWDFEVNGEMKILNKDGKKIYSEYSDGFWVKSEYDSKGNLTRIEDSGGDWEKWKYDSESNEIYHETSNQYWYKKEYDSQGNLISIKYSDKTWEKWEYDSKGNLIYSENSEYKIIDKRTPETIEHNGRKYKLIP